MKQFYTFFMNRDNEKYKLVLYNFKVLIINGEHTECIMPTVITSQSIQEKELIDFCLE